MKFLKTLLMIPIWFLALFTQAKSFKANPIIGSKFLNRCGLHVIRLVAAHGIARLRQSYQAWRIPQEYRDELHQSGFIFIENFLPEEEFKALRKDVENCEGIARQMIQGNTKTQRILLDNDALKNAPVLTSFTNLSLYRKLLSYTASTLSPPLLYLQRIRNGVTEGKADPQKNLHSDTFQPHMKSWYYLDDVPLEVGPLNYVKGSNKLTWKRIKWEYRRSIHANERPDGYSEKGSFRALPEDLVVMDLPEPTALACKANTLVVANTHGFHCRGKAKDGAQRFEIWAYNRPLPSSTGISLIQKTFLYFLMQRHWQNIDKALDRVQTWKRCEITKITQAK